MRKKFENIQEAPAPAAPEYGIRLVLPFPLPYSPVVEETTRILPPGPPYPTKILPAGEKSDGKRKLRNLPPLHMRMAGTANTSLGYTKGTSPLPRPAPSPSPHSPAGCLQNHFPEVRIGEVDTACGGPRGRGRGGRALGAASSSLSPIAAGWHRWYC